MSNYILYDGVLLFSSKQCMIRLAFCDIRNNQGLRKCYRLASAFGSASNNLIISDITKSHSIGVQIGTG